MKIINIDRTQRSIPVQTPSRKFRGSICSLPRKLTKVTPSGVQVNLPETITNYDVSFNIAPILGMFAGNIN